MPAILLTLLPLLAKFAPDLLGLAFGSNSGATQVASRVEATVQRVFGTTDPSAVQTQVDADPSKGADLAAQFAADAAALKAQLADVADARAAQARLVEQHSRLQWVPAAWTAMVAAGFLGMMTVLVLHPVELTVNQVAVLNILFGVLTAEFARCGSFWLGTSSSAIKRGDQAITAASSGQR